MSKKILALKVGRRYPTRANRVAVITDWVDDIGGWPWRGYIEGKIPRSNSAWTASGRYGEGPEHDEDILSETPLSDFDPRQLKDAELLAAWDQWYAGLPREIRRRLSLDDFKRLGDLFKDAFGIPDISKESLDRAFAVKIGRSDKISNNAATPQGDME